MFFYAYIPSKSISSSSPSKINSTIYKKLLISPYYFKFKNNYLKL